MAVTITRAEVDDVADLTREGIKALMTSVRETSKVLRKTQPMDIVEWAQANIIIPSSMSPDRAGPFKPTAIQAAMLRVWQEPGVARIALPKPPRLGITLMYIIALMYMAFHEGDDVLYTERKDDAAQTTFKDTLLPLIEASPNLRDMRRTTRSGARQDTWQNTYLTNGAIYRFRSVTGDGFARQFKARWMFPDESGDAAYRSGRKDSEGDKIALMARRGQQYSDSCIGMPSTPTDEATCTVTREYRRSDQRVWDCPCPHCGTFQPLLPKVGRAFEGPGLKYNLTDAGEVATYVDHRGDTMPDIWYECAACAKPIREEDKVAMVEAGHFRPTTTAQAKGQVGMSTWAIHSTDPKSSFSCIVADHLTALADPTQRQPFVNLVLAQPFQRQATKAVPLTELMARREVYQSSCPQGVQWITWGNDNQKGTDDGLKPPRGEVVVVGWGYGEESWILAHHVIPHEPFSAAWRDELWRLADTVYMRPDGTKLKAFAGAVDCGYNWDAGLTFCHLDPSRRRYRIRAVKGSNTREESKTVAKVGTSAENPTWSWINVNKQTPTTILHERLRIATAGPGRIHVPMSLDEEFLEGLTAYQQVTVKATRKTYWVKDKDGSEVYDCYVYAYARMRRAFEDHPKLRPLLLVPPPPVDVKSAGPVPTPYTGPDRSANSALGVAAAGVPATTTGVATAPTPPTPPALAPSGPEDQWLPRPPQRAAPPPGRFGRPAANLTRGGMGRLW